MGSEIGQWTEWSAAGSIPWELLQYDRHKQLQDFVRELNDFYRKNPALYQVDDHYSGFEWIDINDIDNSIISFIRRAHDPNDFLVFCCNFTPVPREKYGFGVPEAGFYREVLNSDSELFGGSNLGNSGGVMSAPIARHGRQNSISITLPPLGVVAFRHEKE
jgi:1,4-alpha-glucan branching enzyme